MSMHQRITERLTDAFAPTQLVVTDESHKHRGHGGWREGGETHFHVLIVADGFAGQSRVARHRAVQHVLTAELEERVHALAITARTPDEAAGPTPAAS